MKQGRTGKDEMTLGGFVKLTLVLTLVLTLIMLAWPVTLETISSVSAGASAADFTRRAECR